MPIIECIPNVSEGRRREVVDAIAAAIRGVPGVRLLDYSSDASHNRPVFPMAGAAGPIKAAALAMYGRATPASDLRTHNAANPPPGPAAAAPAAPIEGAPTA